MKKNILVFPCGSEIGLEVFRSLKYSSHFELIGGNSVNDHGKFVYQNYIADIPFVDDLEFISRIKEIILVHKIDAIYPTMDSVITKLKEYENELGCKIITSPIETTKICLSKKATYKLLSKAIKVPKTYSYINEINSYPVFVKPNVGYGARNVLKVETKDDLKYFFKKNNKKDYVISEFLPGDEYTVDCFTNRKNELIFVGPRIRNRVSNGISVNTKPVTYNVKEFENIANKLNSKLVFRGAWFFQVKRNFKGDLILLEIASRLGGSSSLFRGIGVNFALLSIYDAFDVDVEIIKNNYSIELDRALDIVFKINVEFENVYVDFDDCLIVNDQVNDELVSFIYQCINKGKKINLITKHKGDLNHKLTRFRLKSLFDEIIHIDNSQKKSDFIRHRKSIFIDDSFSERKEVNTFCNIPVFSPSNIKNLIIENGQEND